MSHLWNITEFLEAALLVTYWKGLRGLMMALVEKETLTIGTCMLWYCSTMKANKRVKVKNKQ